MILKLQKRKLIWCWVLQGESSSWRLAISYMKRIKKKSAENAWTMMLGSVTTLFGNSEQQLEVEQGTPWSLEHQMSRYLL
ncbi:rna methylase [Lasius niger]|uniref:Rna methylase n=1 Tax=Lasius niger TaxID=67767 RepID=A0A0J7MTQ1_LASNI|nr:rna methylase [Lasius niger]